jgi:hypothetical protein
MKKRDKKKKKNQRNDDEDKTKNKSHSRNNIDIGSASSRLIKGGGDVIQKQHSEKVKKETKKIKEEDPQPRQKPVAIKMERLLKEES